jgi:hypothetical protein
MTTLDLRGRIIALSAGNPGDLLARGLWEEHIQELIVRLLRPLLQAQASLLYGGKMPESFRPENPWNEPINFTAALLQLLLGDRDTGRDQIDPPRLYVPVPCHKRTTINASIIAQWSDVCSFIHVSPEDYGITQEELDASSPIKPSDDSRKYLTDAGRQKQDKEFEAGILAYANAQSALEARGYSAMRRKICDTKQPFLCELLDRTDLKDPASNLKIINPLAHILIGGKTTGFSGIMPGIFEEALYAFDARKPIFLISEYGGAAAMLAGWLLNPPETCPPELTAKYYAALPKKPETPDYTKMLAGIGLLRGDTSLPITPDGAFDRLWQHIKSNSKSGCISALLNNGLDEKENRNLLASTSSEDICRYVWRGISRL